MSTMVMCPDNAPSSAMFQRYPSPPVNYPFNGFGYNAPGAQHPQDYNQFQVGDPSVQQVWYNAMYAARPEDWSYGSGATTAITNTPPGMGAYSYRTGNMGLDYSQAPAQMTSSSDSPGDSSSSSTSGSPSNKQLRPPYDWMKKAAYQSAPSTGKTRTKDKYRVVYSDQQRLELEKEFHYSRYITIRRKAELASTLGLSERQVKIWFQNRRAKERKQNKKREEGGVMKMTPDLGDLQDENKQHAQQHMNMQLNAHAQHQVQIQSPSPPPPSVLAQNPYPLHPSAQIHPGQGHHLSHQTALSPQNHVPVHNQYSSPTHLQLSPLNGQNAVSPTSCSMSPVTIKTDIDANDCGATS